MKKRSALTLRIFSFRDKNAGDHAEKIKETEVVCGILSNARRCFHERSEIHSGQRLFGAVCPLAVKYANIYPAICQRRLRSSGIYSVRPWNGAGGLRRIVIVKTRFIWIIWGAIIIIGLSAFMVLKCIQPLASSFWFDDQGKSDAYEFPVYEGTEPLEYVEIVNSLQIPENILKTMSTKGLIETCINYPRFADMMLYDSFQQGFCKVRNSFNGLNELYMRKDAPIELINMFKSIDLYKLQQARSSAILYRYICFIIAQDEIINCIDDSSAKELLKTLESHKNLIKQRFSDYYSPNSPLFVEFRIYKKLYPEFKNLYESHTGLQSFVNDGIWINVTQDEYENLMKHINNIITN